MAGRKPDYRLMFVEGSRAGKYVQDANGPKPYHLDVRSNHTELHDRGAARGERAVLARAAIICWSANTSGGSLRRFCSARLFLSGLPRSQHISERKSRRGTPHGSCI
jgi:hypothetical protein